MTYATISGGALEGFFRGWMYGSQDHDNLAAVFDAQSEASRGSSFASANAWLG